MRMLELLLGRKPEPKKPRIFLTSQGSITFEPSDNAPQSPTRIRKDLLRMVLRDVLTRAGIPAEWLTAEMVRSSSPRRGDGLHVRFLVRHWSVRLLEHGPAFQDEFTQRLLMLDPQARDWLHGFSWQFTLADGQSYPQLPPPASWKATPLSVPVAKVLPIKPMGVVKPQPETDAQAEEAKLLDKLSQRVAEQGAEMKRRRQVDRFAAGRSSAQRAAD
jgi:hypothetical protein